MNVLMLDTEKKLGRNRIAFQSPNKGAKDERSDSNFKEKRLSAATKARIEEKQLIQAMLKNSSSNLSTNNKALNSRRVYSASAQVHSQRRRSVKSKGTERPKSSTPRTGRQRPNFGKNNDG